jgi:FkbM family methyltransferase
LAEALLHAVLDMGQRLLARSSLGVRIAVAVRNQCRCVIRYHLAESPNAKETGERWLVEMAAALPPTEGAEMKHLIDVGANVGEWLELVAGTAADCRFSALAFEPSQSAFAILQQRFGSDPNVQLFGLALGDEPGVLSFFEETAAGKGSTFVPGFLRVPGASRAVEVTTLDQAVSERGWHHVDLLKIDAEGYDLRVLRGAKHLLAMRRIGIVQFEYNRSWQLVGDTLHAAYALLESSGYRVYVLKRDGLFELNYRLYEEYFEYTNFVALSPASLPHFKEYLRGTI